MAQRSEYRVVWKREGRNQTTRIYQSHDSAYRKAQGILGLEAVKDETSFASLPDLEGPPVIQCRPVGDWVPVEHQTTEASEGAKTKMAEWAEYSHPRSDSDAWAAEDV